MMLEWTCNSPVNTSAVCMTVEVGFKILSEHTPLQYVYA